MKIDQYFIMVQLAHVLPLVVAGIRFKKIDPSYRPFIYLLLFGFINESINYISIKLFRNSSISFNTFHIIACWMLLYQFKIWGFIKNRKIYQALLATTVTVWAAENFIYSHLLIPNHYFRVLYAFLIELIIVNRIIYVVTEKTRLIKNTKFFICTGLIIALMYQIIFEGALMADPTLAKEFSKILITSFGFMDVFVQLLYAWAFAVAPAKMELLWEKKPTW